MISVGITNYNAEKYLEKCVNSILDQTYENLEIIIIDDKSTDGSIEILKSIEKENPKIKVVYHLENSGGAVLSRNQIVAFAQGQYCMIVDSDDLFPDKHAFEIFVKEFEKNKELDYVTADILLVDGDGNKKGMWEFQQFSHEEIVSQTYHRSGSGILSMKGMFKTSFFKKTNLKWTGGDTVTGLRCIKYGMNYRHISKPIICYRQHETNDTLDGSKRVRVILNALNYIVDNFDEKVYYPTIEWHKLSDNRKNATKMFLCGMHYFRVFNEYYNRNVKSWNSDLKIEENKFGKSLQEFKNIIINFLSNSLKMERIFEKDINIILNKINSLDFSESQ